MAIRNVVVTDHQDELIDQLVRSGRYESADEVFREGLRLVEREEARHSAAIEALRKAAEVGIAEMERGEYTAFRSFDELERHVIAMTDPIITRVRRD